MVLIRVFHFSETMWLINVNNWSNYTLRNPLVLMAAEDLRSWKASCAGWLAVPLPAAFPCLGGGPKHPPWVPSSWGPPAAAGRGSGA